MPLDRATPIFFDASCLVAAAGSPTGGSSRLLALCEQGFLIGAVSHPVLREAARNIRDNLNSQALRRYDRFRSRIPLRLIPVSTQAQRPYAAFVNAKDAHVLTAAILALAPFLITLDRPFAKQVNLTGLDIQAMTPGEFINDVLPQHPDYDQLP